MKKRIYTLAMAVACMFGMTSCDGFNWEDLLNGSDLVGHINLVASNPQNGTPEGLTMNDTLHFNSALCNVSTDTFYYEDYTLESIELGTVMVGTYDNLLTSGAANLTFPLVGINLRGAATGTYTVSCPIESFEFIEYLDTTDVNTMIASGLSFGSEMGNLFAVAVSEDAYYIGYSGNVRITQFGEEGSLVKGSVNNVHAIYVTRQQIEMLADMSDDERAAMDEWKGGKA